ncbi:MAG: C25 family cysteine peptidase [Bacteroidales bacterium]|nr:C25 family cysteine peptidase [Bacteroidales bacterium]
MRSTPVSTIINYTGHGSTTTWVTSGFSNNDVNNLVNANKLPFIWSVACVNGDFDGPTCFAEAWMRATDDEGNPTGAIAIMASTINQSWAPPMHGQDEMNDILTEQYENNIKRTFGGLSFNGCMEMNDEYGSQGDDMTDTWTLFGDPSVMVRTDNPTEIAATHNPTVFLGSSSFTVNVTDAEGATVAMTMDGEIYGTATIEGGSATVEFEDPVNDPGMMNLVITAFNKIPYIAELEAIPAEGPYVTLADFNLESEANFGQTVNISVDLENVGIEAAEETTATLSTEDEYVSVTDAEEFAGTIEAEETITLTDAFEIEIADDVPDQHMATFMVTIVSGEEEWENQFNITLNAPVFNSGMLTIDDDEGGNGNGRLDPGETVTVTIPVMNEGHAAADNVLAHLTTVSGFGTNHQHNP